MVFGFADALLAGAPWVVRRAVAGDVPALERMLLARCVWMEQRGLPSWRASVAELAGQAAEPDGEMWVLQDAFGRVLGCTTVQTSAPPWGWSAEEFAQPARYLCTTATDPAFRGARPGALLAWWAVDRAAREGFAWVRRGCLFPELVSYYEDQGFRLCHTVRRTHATVFLLAAPARRVSGLAEMFADPRLVPDGLTGRRSRPGAG